MKRLNISFVVILCLVWAAVPATVNASNVFDQPPPPIPVPVPGGVNPGDDVPDHNTYDSSDTSSHSFITQILKIVFPTETLSDALTTILNQAAENEVRSLSEQAGSWAGMIGEVAQSPKQGQYKAIADSGLPTAAALAPALFLLRLALYHWQRLVGGDDSVMRVLGDWLVAGALAVASGPFLDLVVRLSWWMTGKMLGETSALMVAFAHAMFLPTQFMAATLFSGVIIYALAIVGLIGLAGMVFAFLVANATMYVMAVIAPVISVLGVIPTMRWMRSLWGKAVGVLLLLPVIAGGIFKASVSLGFVGVGGGLLSAIIRVFWLAGAAGAMLSLAGILSKFTISATIGAAKKLASAVKGVAETAALAYAGAGAGAGAGVAGAGGGAGGGSGGAGAGAGKGSSGSPPSSSPTTSPSSGSVGGGSVPGPSAAGSTSPGPSGSYAYAQSHLSDAIKHTRQGATASALGMRKLSSYKRSQAQISSLSARKTELAQRQDDFLAKQSGQSPSESHNNFDNVAKDLGMTRSQMDRALAPHGYDGNPDQFANDFQSLNNAAGQQGYDLATMTPQYPEEIGRMTRYYQRNQTAIDGSINPLEMTANGAGAPNIASIVE
ncbi:MAG: hypothetical protein U9Q82_05815 [Chloroflexota bacterium]|nr:hypothetical protein [Chloroflexota bacterium]